MFEAMRTFLDMKKFFLIPISFAVGVFIANTSAGSKANVTVPISNHGYAFCNDGSNPSRQATDEIVTDIQGAYKGIVDDESLATRPALHLVWPAGFVVKKFPSAPSESVKPAAIYEARIPVNSALKSWGAPVVFIQMRLRKPVLPLILGHVRMRTVTTWVGFGYGGKTPVCAK